MSPHHNSSDLAFLGTLSARAYASTMATTPPTPVLAILTANDVAFPAGAVPLLTCQTDGMTDAEEAAIFHAAAHALGWTATRAQFRTLRFFGAEWAALPPATAAQLDTRIDPSGHATITTPGALITGRPGQWRIHTQPPSDRPTLAAAVSLACRR